MPVLSDLERIVRRARGARASEPKPGDMPPMMAPSGAASKAVMSGGWAPAVRGRTRRWLTQTIE